MAKEQTDYAIYNWRPYGILIAGYYSESSEYAVQRPSGSRDWLLMYTVSGEGRVQKNNQSTVACKAGDVVILMPGIPHHYGTKGTSWEFIWVHFIPYPEWSTWLRLPGSDERFFFRHIAGDESHHGIQEALMRMVRHEASAGSSELHRRLAEIALEETLIYIQQTCPAENAVSMDPRIAQILRELQLYPAQKVSLPELARKSCLSTSRLSHLFKEQVGDTVLNIVSKIRMEKAAQLLTGTNRQITEIASDVGFDCTIYFTRKFKEAFGETPSLYRKREQPAALRE
ncbi:MULTISPECIES: helix-turn-helix domain-containing protein [unclassified Paenibacillus]|uniref:helix-turn-helix domain-containing protein n=1 Tax=unclassified Paenibacillus TaxID=185978 RepID=UPI00104593CA|nr:MULTISPECIES: helix-turn-helix domain-containing protein [unclassified Paenibacillus]NIK70937.1 AraC family transcriptional regulator of arabinose operon [Paenibacillus sp. BK720]TCM93086.1 AraC family transcriptional regulator of arabinose operon [Paenibacillus sp. BK033]